MIRPFLQRSLVI